MAGQALQKLNQVQQALKAPKGQKNEFGGYYYRSCEDILEAVKPLLAGATLVISDEVVNVGDRYYVKALAQFYWEGERIDVSAYAREPLEKKGMDQSQITGAASSYARKYALNGLFAIDDTKDADTMDNTQPAAKPTTKAPIKAASGLTRLCPVHKITMNGAISKTGTEYWAHRLSDGSLCFGS